MADKLKILITDDSKLLRKKLREELEKLDAEEDYAYFNYAEALDTGAKELYRRGTLTRKQWDQLCLKYDGVYE